MAYQSDETGRYEVYIQAFPDPRGKFQISRLQLFEREVTLDVSTGNGYDIRFRVAEVRPTITSRIDFGHQ